MIHFLLAGVVVVVVAEMVLLVIQIWQIIHLQILLVALVKIKYEWKTAMHTLSQSYLLVLL